MSNLLLEIHPIFMECIYSIVYLYYGIASALVNTCRCRLKIFNSDSILTKFVFGNKAENRCCFIENISGLLAKKFTCTMSLRFFVT